MQPTRRARLESVILDELSRLVSRELKDPRVPPITFTRAEVTQDGGQATLYVSILGGSQATHVEGQAPVSEEAAKERMAACLKGLTSASGFMRRHLAKVLDVRHIPSLIFREDKGLDNANRVYDLLKKI